MEELKIGDMVSISDWGGMYDCNETWARQTNCTNFKKNNDFYWRETKDTGIITDTICRILGFTSNDEVVGVSAPNGIDYVISRKNIRLFKINSYNSNNKDMNIKQILKNAKMVEPLKSLVKYGITTEDGQLTSEGTQIFIQWMFEESQVDFVKDVVTVLKEADKEAKKDK